MSTTLSKEDLQDVIDQITREVTEKVAGIRLCEGKDVSEENLCTVHASFVKGLDSILAMSADMDMFTRMTQTMLEKEEVTYEDVEDFTKEYFNVLCGRIASELFHSTKIAARFDVPTFYNGSYQPENKKEQFAIRYSSDRNESARMSHFTT